MIAIHSRTKVNAYGYYGSAIIGRVNLQVAAGLYYILRYITLSMLYAYRAHSPLISARTRADTRKSGAGEGGLPAAIRRGASCMGAH